MSAISSATSTKIFSFTTSNFRSHNCVFWLLLIQRRSQCCAPIRSCQHLGVEGTSNTYAIKSSHQGCCIVAPLPLNIDKTVLASQNTAIMTHIAPKMTSILQSIMNSLLLVQRNAWWINIIITLAFCAGNSSHVLICEHEKRRNSM